jgi:hypothetical protein
MEVGHLRIVYQEPHVRRNDLRLNWREVGAGNLRLRKLVAHLNYPPAGARPNVEHSSWGVVFAEWREVILTVERES